MENVLTIVGILFIGGIVVTCVVAIFIAALLKASDRND